MTNTNNTEALARKNAKTRPAIFEVSTLDGGVIIIRPKKVSRDNLPVVEGKLKDGTASTARLTD